MNQIKSSIKVISILLVMMVCVSKVQSQVSIGVPVPSGSAMLDVSSTTKGFLPPRMSEIQRMLILKPEAGLIVYQTDNKKGLYYYDGTSWTYVINQGNNIAANSLLVGGGSASMTGIEPGLAGSVLMSNGTSWIPQQLTFSNNQAGVVGIRDSIRADGTVVAAPTFITSDWLNVGGYAAYLKTSRNIFGKPFNGTADLTSGLVSDGITSISTLAVGTNATITGTLKVSGATTVTGTLTLPSLSASKLLGTDGSKGVSTGNLTGDITTSGFVATLANSGVISGTYGSSTAVPQITVDSKGRITTITTTAITAGGGTTHTISETFGGGIVFYVTTDGLHGLIAETQDQSSSCSWYNAQDVISNPDNHSTDGKKFTDWRLPTKYELNLMYNARSTIGNFANPNYWSSTEYGSTIAWSQYFNDGNQSYYFAKSSTIYVRAVRAF